jgi:NAD(P)H-hydrate repair Nnr-like enzyme with NAD(P)H-hydrate dehydratase domain
MNIKQNNPDLWISSFPKPSSLDHKYTRGMVLINCGPKSKTGAARLAGSLGVTSRGWCCENNLQ